MINVHMVLHHIPGERSRVLYASLEEDKTEKFLKNVHDRSDVMVEQFGCDPDDLELVAFALE